jgi:L-alanine-DL-glutamate epimerase-like enolase superfamily enzyme
MHPGSSGCRDRITAVDVYFLPAVERAGPWRIVLGIRTNLELTGWGEAFALPNRVSALNAMLRDLGALIIGLDPTEHSAMVARIQQDFGEQLGRPDWRIALGAINQALWDLAGMPRHVLASAMLGRLSKDKLDVARTFGPASQA